MLGTAHHPPGDAKLIRIPAVPAEWQFLLTLTDRLRPLTNPAQIQDVAAQLLAAHLGASRVTWPHRDRDASVGAQSIVEASRGGNTVAVSDVRHDPRLTGGDRDLLLAHDIAAIVTAPLIN